MRAGSRRRRGAAAAVLAVALVGALAGALAGCSGDPPEQRQRPAEGGASTAAPDGTTSASGASPAGPSASPTTDPGPPPWVRPFHLRPRTAVRAVQVLAGEIGPRHGTSPAYRRAAGWTQGELERHGWRVRRHSFRVPGGVSWGVPVAAGRSVNLVATRGDVRPGRPWLLVGAHLDTVPQAPGAEDNASGVGVLLALAQAMEGRRTRLPVVLVAFGAEEPRGPTDDDHHYGSRAYVASLAPAERRSLRGMVSLDRVGVGDAVVIGSVEDGDPLRAELVAAARAVDVPVVVESGQRSSDHWSFVRAGLPGIRLGSTPYAAYHSPADVPSVVDPAQLERTARVVLRWLG